MPSMTNLLAILFSFTAGTYILLNVKGRIPLSPEQEKKRQELLEKGRWKVMMTFCGVFLIFMGLVMAFLQIIWMVAK